MTGSGDPVDPPGGGSPNDAAAIRTFLIADVRGWTLFTQERGDEAAAKLAAKFADTVREVVETRGGTLLELRGDEAMCVFTSSREAIRSAVELQVRFAEETVSQPDLPLTVGIGLDAGEAVPVEGGYRGGALNLAARLCGQARAGEVLASREVTHLARRLDGVRYDDRGAMTFKNIPDPVEVVRVVPEGEDPIDRLRPFTPAPPAPTKRRSQQWAIAVGIAVVALVAISIPVLGGRDGGSLNIDANSVARLNPGDTALDLATPLDDRPGASAAGSGSLWVVQPDKGHVVRMDLQDGEVIDRIRVGPSPAGIAVGLGSVWVTNSGDGTVSRIIDDVTETLRVGSTPTGITVGDGALWIADTGGAALLRVDPTSTGEPQAVELPGQPSDVEFTSAGVWTSYSPNAVARIDPADMAVDFATTVGAGPTAIHAAFGSIWVANHLDGTVSRVDPSTGRVQATIDVGEGPDGLADADGSLWVAHAFDDTLARIDPVANQLVETTRVGARGTSLVADRDALWLAVGAPATGHRGGTLAVSSPEALPETLDLAIVHDTWLFQILTITNDGLLAYKKVAGPDGRTLVPDLASALPEVLDDGLTYRFPLRAGIRYSTGEPVRPEDFRRAIERSLTMHEAGYLFGAIAGADACLHDPEDPDAIVTTCDLSDSIVVDEGSVTFRLAVPDPTLPFKLAMPYAFPVPADTPTEDQGHDPLPATGPYQIAEVGPDSIELRRNPEFSEWSGGAQPEGFVDAISYRFGENTTTSFDRLEAGALDLMIDEPSPEDLDILRSTHPDQVVPWPGSLTLFVGFDVQKPPFNDRRARQAVAYAIDREDVVDLLGGPTVQRPTCQILPPGLEGYEPFCPFTREPENNVWTAPDLDRAQALIEASGAAEARVQGLVSEVDLPSGAVETMEYVVDVLGDLGMRVDLRVLKEEGAYFDAIIPPKGLPGRPGSPAHPHVFLNGWLSEYPAAGDFIPPQFHCDELVGWFNGSGWCSKPIDAKMEDALQLSLAEPGEANRAWAAIDRELVDEAVSVPLTNPVYTHAISDRVENVQINPQWGVLLSRLWVK